MRKVSFIQEFVLATFIVGFLTHCGGKQGGSGLPVGSEDSVAPKTSGDPKQNPIISTKGENTETQNSSGNSRTVTSSSFFLSDVKKAFDAQCLACHTGKAMTDGSGRIAPATIFAANSLLPKVDNADTSQTTLFKKITGVTTHGGGNQCATNSTVCDVVKRWQQLALDQGDAKLGGSGAAGTSPTPGAVSQTTGLPLTFGEVTRLSTLGSIDGFAVNPDSPASTVAVELTVDGVVLPQVQASNIGFAGGYPGNHRFSYKIPAQYLDGKKKTVMVYAVIGDKKELLNPSNNEFYGYATTAAGRTYYTGTVLPALDNACGACHAGSLSYENGIIWLLSPAPHQGGTRTNNLHINNPAAANGEQHGGGNRCGGVNGGVCANLQTWWDMEFSAL